MGKCVLITGASSGMGYAAAELLAQNGYIVYGAARRVEKMKSLEKYGVKTLHVDVTDERSIQEVLKTIDEDGYSVNVLINAAGYGAYGAIEDMPMDEARRQMEVNLFGLARLTQLMLPRMRAAKGGYIINISSIGGRLAGMLGGWYHASKYAVEAYSDSLRMETSGFGIKTVIIEPGAINTEWQGITMDKCMKISGNGPYKELAQPYINTLQGNIAFGTEPEKVAQLIMKILTKKNPKPRYLVGTGAGIFVFMKRMLSDKQFDKMYTFLLSKMG